MGASYKRPVKVESVETEEELNAGHSVEPAREMQDELWAMAIGRAAATSDSRTARERRGRADGADGRGRRDDMVREKTLDASVPQR